MIDTTTIKVHIRFMIRKDLQEVLQIEEDSHTYPWSEDEFRKSLRKRNHIGMVAELNHKVVGFIVYELHKTEYAIHDLGVHSEYRRCGIGAQIIERLIDKLSLDKRPRITLNARETYLDAQLFFQKMGFKAIRVLRDHYDNGEDAYLMVRRFDAD